MYGSKEKYLARLQQDPNNERPVQFQLPRMAFELTNMQYDATRKQQTMIKDGAISPGNPHGMFQQFVPVPYDLSFDLHILTREIDDGLQIIEMILPWFTPDYTVAINFETGLGQAGSRNTPIVLNNISFDDNTETSVQEVRLVSWTLNFTMKSFLYGPSATVGQILEVNIQYYNKSPSLSPLANNGVWIYGNSIKGSNVLSFSQNVQSLLSANDIIQFGSDVFQIKTVSGNTANINTIATSVDVNVGISKFYNSNAPIAIYWANVSPNNAYVSSYTIDTSLIETGA